MRESIENRVPYLTLPIRKLLYSGVLMFEKGNLRNMHKRMKTVVANRKKQNLNVDMVNELDFVSNDFLRLLNTNRILRDLNYEIVIELIQNREYHGWSSSNLYVLWFIYNILLWSEVFNMKDSFKLFDEDLYEK